MYVRMYLNQCSVCYIIFAGSMVVHVCMYLNQCSVCYIIFAGSMVICVHISYNAMCVLHNTCGVISSTRVYVSISELTHCGVVTVM